MNQYDVLSILARNRQMVVRQTGALLDRAAALKQTAGQAAKAVGQYFSPWFATRRAPDGSLVRDGREGAVTNWPGEAGMASAGVRGLMLTETQARHAAGVAKRARRDGRLLKYNLSSSHPRSDICDTYASTDNGHGPGVYEPDDFPDFPHPRCRCFASTVERNDDDG